MSSHANRHVSDTTANRVRYRQQQVQYRVENSGSVDAADHSNSATKEAGATASPRTNPITSNSIISAGATMPPRTNPSTSTSIISGVSSTTQHNQLVNSNAASAIHRTSTAISTPTAINTSSSSSQHINISSMEMKLQHVESLMQGFKTAFKPIVAPTRNSDGPGIITKTPHTDNLTNNSNSDLSYTSSSDSHNGRILNAAILSNDRQNNDTLLSANSSRHTNNINSTFEAAALSSGSGSRPQGSFSTIGNSSRIQTRPAPSGNTSSASDDRDPSYTPSSSKQGQGQGMMVTAARGHVYEPMHYVPPTAGRVPLSSSSSSLHKLSHPGEGPVAVSSSQIMTPLSHSQRAASGGSGVLSASDFLSSLKKSHQQ